MIPKQRPVVWQDIEDLRVRFGLGHNQICTYLGIINDKWKIIRKDQKKLEQPIKEPTLAILVRIYDEYPELAPDTYKPDMRQVYHDLCDDLAAHTGDPNAMIKHRHFSILFGRNSSAGYSWLDSATPPRSVVSSIIDCLYRGQGRTNKVLNRYAVLFKMCQIEANARGIDPFKTGEWRHNDEPE